MYRLLSKGLITPLTQKVIWAFWLRAAVLRRTRRNRDAVTNSDGIFTDQNFFNQELHDSLAFDDTKRCRRRCASEEGMGKGFCQAQESSAILGLVNDRLQLST